MSTEENCELNDLIGRVKWFDARKGYGFIHGPDGQDVLVHFSEIQADGFRCLRDGACVKYDAVRGFKGLSARNVVRIDKSVATTTAEVTTVPQQQPTSMTLGQNSNNNHHLNGHQSGLTQRIEKDRFGSISA